MTTAETLALTVSLVSAVISAIALRASHRSAVSAERAEAAAADAERGALLRQILVEAKQIQTEADACVVFVGRVTRCRRGLAVFAGGLGNSQMHASIAGYEKKRMRAEEIGTEARPFSSEPSVLLDAAGDELNRVAVKLTVLLSELRGLRTDLERERDELERESSQFRDQVLQQR